LPALAQDNRPAVGTVDPLVSLDDAITGISWDDSGESFYAGLANGSIYYISKDGELLRHWKAHKGGVTRVAVNPDGADFASAGEDGRVLLWDKNRRETIELANEPVWIEQLEWSSRGNVLAAAAGKSIYLWRGSESIGVWYDARRHVQAMSWQPAGSKLATATNKGLYLWHLGNEEPAELLAFPGAAVSVAWKPDGRALAVGTQDGFLQIWRQGNGSGSSQLTMSGYPGKVSHLSWHPQKNVLATAGGSDLVIWDMSGSKRKAVPVNCHEHMITAVSFSPDGSYVASSDMSGQVYLCSAKGECIGALRTGVEITSLTWDVPGSRLLLGGIEGRIDTFYLNSLL